MTISMHPPAHSLSNNYLTNFGKDMSGVISLAESLKQNRSLTSLKYVTRSLNSSSKVSPHTIL